MYLNLTTVTPLLLSVPAYGAGLKEECAILTQAWKEMKGVSVTYKNDNCCSAFPGIKGTFFLKKKCSNFLKNLSIRLQFSWYWEYSVEFFYCC